MSSLSPQSAAIDGFDHIERSLRKSAMDSSSKPQGWAQLALYLSGRGEHRRAVAVLWEAVIHCGDLPVLLQAIADLLVDAPGHPDRLEALARLARACPNDAKALTQFGLAALSAPNPADGLATLRRAVELGESDVEILLTLASAERQLGSVESAVKLYERVLAIAPEHPTALVERWHCGLSNLDWVRTTELEPKVAALFSKETTEHVAPFMALALPAENPELLRDFVERGAKSFLSGRGLRRVGVTPGERLRVGYLSADFLDHATTLLSRGMFVAHDKSRFEIFIYNYGPRSTAEGPAHIAASIEHWHDIAALDDPLAATLIRSHKLDVLVEMKGHTAGARPEISRQRVAPVQVHYLGFPGPVGGFGIDYFVADDVTVPVGTEKEFNVPVIKLPRAYQVNDSQRAVPVAVTRESLGLSEDTTLIANFNQLWKIRPEFMRVWGRALRAFPNAMLWLLGNGETGDQLATENLQIWLQQEGLQDVGTRICFVPRLGNVLHMNRLATVDLCVDQLPCSSHTTAADSLWAGVPLLTVTGRTFAGRVAASLLTTHDEQSFIAANMLAYEARLFELLADPRQLVEARRRLEEKRHTSPLFDTAGFVRDWELTLSQLASDGSTA